MPFYPTLQESGGYQRITDTFMGYNHNLRIADGEWYDCMNLTSDYYPLMANRWPRMINSTALTNPTGIICKDSLLTVENNKIYYGGSDTGITLASLPEGYTERTLISMGAYVVIFPDKYYYNTKDAADHGYIEATKEVASVTITPCKEDGSSLTATVSNTAPASPTNGDYWIDTSGVKHSLKQWSETSGMWITVATTYVSISGLNSNAFSKYDGVYISGLEAPGTATQTQKDQVAALNGSHILYSEPSGTAVIIVGFIDGSISCTGTITMARRMPKMDYITECNNRLWGCYYGADNGEIVNRIYCCALGDFKNWEKFMGLSTDSYFASCGTDGPWTGACTVNNMPVFFKEDCLHKVSVSSSGAHQIIDLKCKGVKPGCHKSIAVINEVAYYKATGDVMAYDGAIPQSIGNAFGDADFDEGAWGAAVGSKYYLNMWGWDDNDGLYVYDTKKGFWLRETPVEIIGQPAVKNNILYLIAYAYHGTNDLTFTVGKDYYEWNEIGEYYVMWTGARTGNPKALGLYEYVPRLMSIGNDGTLAYSEEEHTVWWAVSGLLGYDYVGNSNESYRSSAGTTRFNYVGRFNLRMALPEGSDCDLWLQYDEDPEWQHVGHIDGRGTQAFLLPVQPRRCDHFRFGLHGHGAVRLYSLTKIHEYGSDEQ